MTITIYELLGLVKDGKMPKKIKYYDRIYTYDNYKGDSGYVDKTVEPYKWFVKECDIERDLNDTVEILEEENKIEQKENYIDFANLTNDEKYNYLYEMISILDNLETEIYKLIDEINKLKEDK